LHSSARVDDPESLMPLDVDCPIPVRSRLHTFANETRPAVSREPSRFKGRRDELIGSGQFLFGPEWECRWFHLERNFRGEDERGVHNRDAVPISMLGKHDVLATSRSRETDRKN